MFILDQKLKQDTFLIGELQLSLICLMNNCNFPWIILVPKRNNIIEIGDLNSGEYMEFMQEVRYIAEKIKHFFQADKINIAMLGNIVKQLHCHIIARFEHDIAWPKPVWNISTNDKYSQEQSSILVRDLKKYLIHWQPS
jgi:diadenosine tetraphosphate (Ap4A) HIT family hydrolase